MAEEPQATGSPALQTVAAWLSSPAPKQPSAAVEAAAPAGVAEGKEAVQGAAEAGAAPPLPGASVLPADDGAGGAAASDEAAAARLTVPRPAVDEAVVTMPMPAFAGRQPALHNPVGKQGGMMLATPWEAASPAGVPTTTLPSPPPPTAACASMPALHIPVGAASTAVATSPAVHVLSPRGLTSAAVRPLAPPPGLALPPAGPPPASGTQASEDPVAAAGATQALVPQTAPVEAGAGLQAPPFGLSVADVPCHSRGNYVWLHKQARAALNNLYATGLQEAVAPEFAWREYVCAHPASCDLVGPGIQSFVAEPIAGTRDANRRGHPRIDFVVRRVDGWVSRLHPGRRPQEDAAVCWFPPGAFAQGGQASGVGAGMYVASAAQPGPAERPPVLLTVEEAARVPPADRMGKAAAYEHMTWLRGRLGRNEEHGLIDVTHCADFAWQTWLANVRDHQAAFIGPGICSVFVTPPEQPEVQLRAHRCDGTWACLQLDRTWQGQGWKHAVEFLGVSQLPGGQPS